MIQLSLVSDILLLFCNLQFLLIVSVLVRLLSDLSNEMLDNSLVNSRGQENGNTCSMENVCSEVQTVQSQSDHYDVTIIDNDIDIKPEVKEIFLNIDRDLCKSLPAGMKQEITATFQNHNESKETKLIECSNSLMSIEVKNVFSLCDNIGDWRDTAILERTLPVRLHI